MFVFDASGSLREEFGENLQIMKDIVNTVAVGMDNTRITVIMYSGYSRVEHRFNQSFSRESVLKTIDGLSNSKGITNTGAALRMAADELSYEKVTTGGLAAHRHDLLTETSYCRGCEALTFPRSFFSSLMADPTIGLKTLRLARLSETKMHKRGPMAPVSMWPSRIWSMSPGLRTTFSLTAT